MKKILFSLHFITATLLAQKVTYNYSQEFETIKKHTDLGFYRFNANEYAEVYYKAGDNMTFQIFDNKFSTVKKLVEAPLPEDSKKYTYERFSPINSKFYWFYSTWERKTETERLFALPFDKTSLKFSPKEIKLVEAGRMVPYGKYDFHTSKDSSKLLVTYTLKPTERKDKLSKNVVGFNLFDDAMNKLYAAEIQMPYSEYDMNNLGYEVDSRGNIYMLAEVRINNEMEHPFNESSDKDGKNAYRYELIRVNKQSNTLQSIKINLENKFTRSVLLSEDLSGNIVITGYYSDKKNSNSSNGAYIIRLEYDENNTVKNVRTTYCEFPAETLKAYESERSKRKMDRKDKNEDLEAFNLSMRNIVFYEDGSILIVGEEYYYTTYTYRSGNSTYTSTTYYYNDILALKADKNGKTQWCNKIPKSQSGSSTFDLSYHLHHYKGESYFLYLDNIKNINLSLTETPATHVSGRGGYLTMVKIDAAGKMTKASILDSKEEEIQLNPSNFESVNDHIIVDRIRADRKESRIFKLEIN